MAVNDALYQALLTELTTLRRGVGATAVKMQDRPELLKALNCPDQPAAGLRELKRRCEMLGAEGDTLLVAFALKPGTSGLGLEKRRSAELDGSTWVRRENRATRSLAMLLLEEERWPPSEPDSDQLTMRGDPGSQVSPTAVAGVLNLVTDEQVREIAANNIFVSSSKKDVGYLTPLPIGVYLDLHTASCDPRTRQTLAQGLAQHVSQTLKGTQNHKLVLATPRQGNVLLGSNVAEILNLPFLMVRTKKAPRFGYPIEGRYETGAEAVIVDDLVMEGSFIRRCAGHLRAYGLRVTRCISLFERSDGDARETLEQAALTLISRYQIDDSTLRGMAEADLPNDSP